MDTLEKIIQIIRENGIDELELTPDTRIDEDSEISSFDRLMIVNAIEDEYSLEFDTDDFQKIKCLGDVADILKNKYKR